MADDTIILHTRLQRPPVASDILPRARLLDRLNEGLQRTLTLISAPAGYGKSTLASRWVAMCDSPCGWVSLDEGESDLRLFLSYFLAAVRTLFPRAELRSEVLLKASQLPPIPVLASYLLNDLHQINEPFILVLDDYHYIRGGSPVHDLLVKFLAHPPRAMHLVLLTRRDPALPISRLRGRGQLTEIRAADLRFTIAEASAFLKEKLKIPVDDTTAALLEEKTEGWVTGLRLTGLYLRGQDDLEHRVQKLSGNSLHIAEYLVEEVLSNQDPKIAAYLIETSILDRFSAPLCMAVHSRGIEVGKEEQCLDADRFIEWLVESNLFVIPLDDQGHWFRYHHLFQEFLQALLRKRTGVKKIAELHMQASKWFAGNNLIEEAVQHALAGENTGEAVRLVVACRYELMNTSQFIRMHHLTKLLPMDVVDETPLLASARAFVGIEQGQDSDVYNYTSRADRMLTRLQPDSAEYDILKSEVHVLQGFIDMAVGDPDRGLTHAEEAISSPFLSGNALLIRSLGILTMTLCHQMKGNPGQAVKVLKKTLSNPSWPDNLRARLHFYLAIMHYMDANLAGAMSASRECLHIIRSPMFTHTKTFALYLLGASHYLRNETEEAESHTQSVLDDYETSNPSYVANAAIILALINLARDNARQAEQVLNRISSHFEENAFTTIPVIVQAFQVEFALRQGDIERARQLSRNIDFNVRPPIWFSYVPQLTPVKLLLAEGTDESLKEARTRLIDLDERMRLINRRNVRIDVLALLSLILRKLGEEAAALENLQAALSLAEPGGWVRNFVDLGASMTDLLERLSQVQPGHKFARQVLEACRAEARSNFFAASNGKRAPGLAGQPHVSILTKRETELLLLLAEGLNNKEIAARLYIATETVKTHLQNIYKKLNARNRFDAVLKARASGLIKLD